jgi:hypothetical protein
MPSSPTLPGTSTPTLPVGVPTGPWSFPQQHHHPPPPCPWTSPTTSPKISASTRRWRLWEEAPALADISVCRFPLCPLLMPIYRLPLDPVNSIAGSMGIIIPTMDAIAT